MHCPAATASLCILTLPHPHTRTPKQTIAHTLKHSFSFPQTRKHTHASLHLHFSHLHFWLTMAMLRSKGSKPLKLQLQLAIMSVYLSFCFSVIQSVRQSPLFAVSFHAFVSISFTAFQDLPASGWHLCTFPFAIVISFFVHMYADGPKSFAACFNYTLKRIAFNFTLRGLLKRLLAKKAIS